MSKALLCLLSLAVAAGAQQTALVPLDACDAELAEPRWKYIGGWEFPGAQGALARDTAVLHEGAAAYRLTSDFTGGGAYVGLWRELDDLIAPDVKAIRLWVKAEGTRQIGVRLVDGTDQCHQANGVQLQDTDEWQELVLTVADLVGQESWGGANDQQWHPTAKGLGINLGADTVGATKQATLWVDDLRAEIVPPGVPTLHAVKLSQPAGRPSYGLTLTYTWDAEPMGRDYETFVHFVGPDGARGMQGDHVSPQPTSTWSGPLVYDKVLVLPNDVATGTWRIRTGLWDRKTGQRLALKAGPGVVANEDLSYDIGSFDVADDAPIPQLPPPSLDLDGYSVTFDEDFDGPTLDVSREGPGTRWIAHTPYWGDFGDAGFGDPGPEGPFELKDGNLYITARKNGDRWQAGLLSSVDTKGQGFSQQYGYFEMRAQLPPGPGTWPAFWLLSQPGVVDKTADGIEIDVVEQYGQFPHALHTTVHRWLANGTHTGEGQPAIVEGMTTGFHTYGAMVGPDVVTFYYDRAKIWEAPSPKEVNQPLYLLVNLALGGGWPIDQTPDPSVMIVDYVRAWAKTP